MPNTLRFFHPSGGPPRRVLITGATGFLGRLIWPRLLGAGCDLVAIVRAPDDRAARGRLGLSREDERVSVLAADLLAMNESQLARALRGVDTVIHAAATPKLDAVLPGALHALHVDVTKRLATAANAAGVSRFIHLSTAFLPTNTSGALDNVPAPSPRDVEAANEYEASKAEGERVLIRELAHSLMYATILRPGIILPPRVAPLDVLAASPLGSFALMLGAGSKAASGARTITLPGRADVSPGFVRSEDVVAAVLHSVGDRNYSDTPTHNDRPNLHIAHVVAHQRPSLGLLAASVQAQLPGLSVRIDAERGGRRMVPWRPYLNRERSWRNLGDLGESEPTLTVTVDDVVRPLIRLLEAHRRLARRAICARTANSLCHPIGPFGAVV